MRAAWRIALAGALVGVAFAGCGDDRGDGTVPPATVTVPPSDDAPSGVVTATSEACVGAPLGLTSPAFADGEPIPARHAGDGGNVSPPLAWTCAPLGTSLVLVVDDVDAPGGSFIHWVLLALTPDGVTTADGTVPAGADPGGVLAGTSDAGFPGWIGPLPPPGSGPHDYVFTAYAVADVAPPTDQATTADQLLAAIDGHVVATATLTGTYER